MNADIKAVLVLPHLRVQNVNAISGPLSWGFPAPSAFTGFAHALARKVEAGMRLDIRFEGVGVVCHDFTPLVSDGYVKSFRLTRNPLDVSGVPPAFVEEGRAHMQVSLVIGLHGGGLLDYDEDALPDLASRIAEVARAQRLAGGSILENSAPRAKPYVAPLAGGAEHREKQWYRLRRRLLPGFALVARDDLLQERLDQMRHMEAATSPLDALLDLTSLHWDCDVSQAGEGKSVDWHIRPRSGWLVPTPVGYSPISPLYPPGEVRNARDMDIPFCFVESIYGLGQWISPHRINEPKQLFWHHHAEPESGLYRCVNTYATSPVNAKETYHGQE